MNNDDLRKILEHSINTLITEDNKIENHQAEHKNNLTLKQQTKREEIKNLSTKVDEKFEQIEDETKIDIRTNSDEIRSRFNEYNEKIEKLKFEDKLSSLIKEHEAIKEEQIKILNQQFKKTRQELSYKINAFEREFNAKTKEYEADRIETKRTFKTKLNELIRKLDFDIKKETEQGIKNSAPLDKELLVVNEAIQIRTINNEIKKIRARTLENIYEIKKHSHDEQEELELDYNIRIIEKEKEQLIYREELNVKIAELNEKIDHIKHEEQYNEDKYELDFRKVLIIANKENELKLNELKKDYLLKVIELKKVILEKNHINNLKILEMVKGYNQTIKSTFSDEIDECIAYNNQFYLLQSSQIDGLSLFLKNQFEVLTNLSIIFFNDSKVDFLSKNDTILNESILNNIPSFSWQNYDYDFNFNRFRKSFGEYKKMRQARLERFFKDFHNSIDTIRNVLDNILKIVTNFINHEIEEDKIFFKEFTNHNQDNLKLTEEVFQNKELNLIAKYENELKNLVLEEYKVNENYSNKIKVILEVFDNDIKSHSSKENKLKLNLAASKTLSTEKLKEDIKDINNKIKNINQEKNLQISNIKKLIKEKTSQKHLENLNDKKEKIKLL